MKNTLLLLSSILLVLAGCRKSERDNDQSLGAAEDELRAQSYFYDLFSTVNEAAIATPGIRSFTTHLSCATITTDTLASPRIMTIDFGTVNCAGTDGRTRRGKLHCTFSSLYSDSLSVVTITPLNYYLNDHKVDGTITLTNLGNNALGQLQIRMVTSNGKINPVSNDWYTTWKNNQVFTLVSGQATLTPTDDVFSLTGTSNGQGRHGEAYAGQIQTALTYPWNCGEVISGLNDITPGGINIRHIDYGSANCDQKVTVSIQGYTYEIHNMY